MKLTEKILSDAESIVIVKNLNAINLPNFLGKIVSGELRYKGFYSCNIDGVKTLFILRGENEV